MNSIFIYLENISNVFSIFIITQIHKHSASFHNQSHKHKHEHKSTNIQLVSTIKLINTNSQSRTNPQTLEFWLSSKHKPTNPQASFHNQTHNHKLTITLEFWSNSKHKPINPQASFHNQTQRQTQTQTQNQAQIHKHLIFYQTTQTCKLVSTVASAPKASFGSS